jgi:hypothetical protein
VIIALAVGSCGGEAQRDCPAVMSLARNVAYITSVSSAPLAFDPYLLTVFRRHAGLAEDLHRCICAFHVGGHLRSKSGRGRP